MTTSDKDISSIVITVYDKKDLEKSNEALSNEEITELKELLEAVDFEALFETLLIPITKPRVLHNYRLKLDGTNEVEHWVTELK